MAAFLVCFVHIFIGDYYSRLMAGGTMFVFTCLRWTAYLCVPLYLLLSGYLCVNRTDVKKTYQKLLPLLIQIIIMTGLTTLTVGRERQLSSLRDFLWYSFGGGTGWYAQMYVGLLLLMPFLNKLWKLLSKPQRQALLLALIFISAARSYSDSLFFSYWERIYPLTYYFLGAYLRDYKLRLRTGTVAALFAVVILLFTSMTFMHTDNGVFSWTLFGGFEIEYNAFFAMVATVLLFTLVSRIKIPTSKLLALIGRNTLGIYLLENMVKGRLLTFISSDINNLSLSLGSLPLWVLYAAAACLIGAVISEVISIALRFIAGGSKRLLAKSTQAG